MTETAHSTAPLPSGELELQVRVSETRAVGARVRSLSLKTLDGTRLPAWEPGAHIDLVVAENTLRPVLTLRRPHR